VKLVQSLLFSFLFVLVPTIMYSKTDSIHHKMIADLDIIKNTFEVMYAPKDWKKSYAGWDLDEQISLAKSQVHSNPNMSIKEFQSVLKGFCNSTRDYHVGITFYSTEAAYLPFRVQSGGQGRYFLTWIDNVQVPPTWNVGDEVLLFDGIPTDDAIAQIKSTDLGNPESLTDQGLAEIFLTARLGSLGKQVPKGRVFVTLKHRDGTVFDYPMRWDYTPEKITHTPFAQAMAMSFNKKDAGANSSSMPKKSLWSHSFFKKEMTAGFYKGYLDALSPYKGDEARLIGSRIGFLPDLGQLIWASDYTSYFDAYLYENEQHQIIGYVRIPDYLGIDAGAREFQHLMDLFERTSDALVIDQTNNPGGHLFHVYALGSMLSEYPLHVPSHRVSLTQEDIYFAYDALDEIHSTEMGRLMAHEDTEDAEEPTLTGYPITLNVIFGLIRYFNFIIDEWDAGRSITQVAPMYGIDYIWPSPSVQYTKPILFMVNHLAFSCGDFLPAILQDNNRATIFGTRTAGAGGYVLSHAYPNRFGISHFSFTGSIAERVDSSVLENLGVVPDIIYEVTAADLQNNYKDYVNAVNAAVMDLISPKPLEQFEVDEL